MVRHFASALGMAVVLMSTPATAECIQEKQPAATAQPARPSRPKFWQDPKLRQQIGITDQQSAAIEQVFASSITSLREAGKELNALEAVLSRTIKESTADLITVSQQIDKVEAARSAYNKARTVMLYRIDRLLSPEQRVKVAAMRDRDEEQRRHDERRKEDERRKSGKSSQDPR